MFRTGNTGAPANADPTGSSTQSAESIGQLDAPYQSATNDRASAFCFAVTNTRSTAEDTVALSGSELVSNRNNASNTWKLPNAKRRPAVNNAPDVFTAIDDTGG